MDRRALILATIRRAALSMICGAIVCCSSATAARAVAASWDVPGLDIWFYPNGTSHGARAFAPSFLNELSVVSHEFEPMTIGDPARLGNALVAFNTSSQITSGLPTYRYHVTSVTVTATVTYSGDPVKLLYDDERISPAEILGELDGGQPTTKRPMELYGVGLRSGYSGYEFSGATSGPPLVDEITKPYSAGSYFAYAIGGSESEPGTVVDVMNSVTGGYSETDLVDHQTDPFTAIPWSIGTTTETTPSEAHPGEYEVNDDAHFTFSVDLNAPGVKSYIQQSLSSGAIGFFLSSLHFTGEQGDGGGYPRWYLKESAGFPYGAPIDRMPHLEIEYELLPPQLGDYNDNGTVDAADYVLWRNGGPLANQADDPAHITPQDYTEWRARFGNSSVGGGALMAGPAVPEPSAVTLALVAISFIGWSVRTRIGR